MSLEALVFDMDGTILHSRPDLAIATNEALSRMGFPPRGYDEILGFMGDGSSRLIDMSCPPGATPAERARTFGTWRSIYLESDYSHTVPFPGITEALAALRAGGVKTAILSNKFDAGVQALAGRFFPGLFDAVRGELPPLARKPDPTSLLQVLDELGVQPERAAYVGDTNVDVRTARNAGMRMIGVSWGYDSASPLPRDCLYAYIEDPRQLVSIALRES